ncbi:NAD(P)-dependent oxidoreductase [Puia dinghuensis]|uniref:NADH-flavin reductase n=1 Tax=Puia dinghuensis TaxID=1792502 RepID=A0A8J2XT92_9BACT|nr:NAD(P)H-binding protein [Puia dinghuensis]GGB02145.1 NADH-flavin reductase [Puia dinghuensis]
MLSNTTIAVIGGTGKSGKFVVRELIRQNIPFRILLRNAASCNLPVGQIIQGDVRNPEAVLKVAEGCTAIISTLGQPKGEPSIFSQATRNVLTAMQAINIKRYILTTGLNVDTPVDKKGPVTQAGTNWMREHYPETTADKQLEYELLAGSAVDWTLVRLPLIGLTENSEAIATSLEDCPGTGIHAADLARFLVSQVLDKNYIRQAPFLANLPIFMKSYAP